MVWEEVFNGNFSLHPNTVVNAWDGATTTNKAAQAGFFVVNNYGHYLDQQQPPGPSHYLWVDTWQNFYLNDPLDGTNLTPAQEKLWGEQVDATNIDSRMWPRACGGAERFWSPASYKDVTTAAFRLSNQRCRMVQRGVGAGPIRPAADYGYCFLPPTSPWLNMAEM
ncbi:hexa1 [Symbiodinium sp. KB8]|nr:hexa1 [Symbiodinium sp. KB8]